MPPSPASRKQPNSSPRWSKASQSACLSPLRSSRPLTETSSPSSPPTPSRSAPPSITSGCTDTDGDGFSNAEEFVGKSNPKDARSLPAAHTKLVFKEILKDELSLKFVSYISDSDLQIQRTAPAAKKFTAFTKVGDNFAIEKGGEAVYQISKVEKREVKDGGITDIKPVVILTDIKNPKAKPLEIVLGKVLDLPTLRARITNTLGKDEVAEGGEGAEISFPSVPDAKYTILKVTDQQVDLEYMEPGKTEKTQFSLELK